MSEQTDNTPTHAVDWRERWEDKTTGGFPCVVLSESPKIVYMWCSHSEWKSSDAYPDGRCFRDCESKFDLVPRKPQPKTRPPRTVGELPKEMRWVRITQTQPEMAWLVIGYESAGITTSGRRLISPRELADLWEWSESHAGPWHKFEVIE